MMLVDRKEIWSAPGSTMGHSNPGNNNGFSLVSMIAGAVCTLLIVKFYKRSTKRTGRPSVYGMRAPYKDVPDCEATEESSLLTVV